MKVKLLGDDDLFVSARHKVTYMTSFLKEDAYKMVRPCLNHEATEDSVWAVLDLAYDDPHRRGTAERELKK